MSDHTVARQYSAGSACSVCEVKVKAEAACWGTFVMATMQDLCVQADIVTTWNLHVPSKGLKVAVRLWVMLKVMGW